MLKESNLLILKAIHGTYTRTKKKRRVHIMCNDYFIAWPRILNIGQIDISFTVVVFLIIVTKIEWNFVNLFNKYEIVTKNRMKLCQLVQ